MFWQVAWLCLAAAGAALAYGDAEDLKARVKELERQVMRQQWYAEEFIRANGQSGVVQVRHSRDGTSSWYSEGFAGSGVAAIHDHADSYRTVGMGEFTAVLNGVAFQTRHNDYLLVMPHRTSSRHHALEDIPFPEVPHSVLAQPTVAAQVAEMHEYFRAFAEQDESIRNYKPYFPPLLSYMEGTWTHFDEKVDEPFPGERHWISAPTWESLEDIFRFESYNGEKEGLENRARLPRAIAGFNSSGAIWGQFNYRIACHMLKHDLKPDRLSVIDDLASRMVHGLPLEEYANTREARFQVHPTDSASFRDGRYQGMLIDKLMEEIPGMDNYQADLHDDYMNNDMLETFTAENVLKNVAYYHHHWRVDTKDAMGRQTRHVGMHDETVYRAKNTQSKVVGMSYNDCHKYSNNLDSCYKTHQKWSWAIPMEVLYLTPLARWNPYDLEYKGWSKSDPRAKWVTEGGRDGTYERPYNGTNSIRFLQTPAEFFEKEEHTPRPADTTGGAFWVLDRKGIKRKVRASGMRTIIPELAGGKVPKIRTRYPIMPVHQHGGVVSKELEALKDVVLDPERFAHIYRHRKGKAGKAMVFALAKSASQFDSHFHVLVLNEEDRDLLRQRGAVSKYTDMANGHQHGLVLVASPHGDLGHVVHYVSCDSKPECWDGHASQLLGAFDRNWDYVEDVDDLHYPPHPSSSTTTAAPGPGPGPGHCPSVCPCPASCYPPVRGGAAGRGPALLLLALLAAVCM